MDHNLLIVELQALVAESKRKYPDVKDAAEASLAILKPAHGPPSVDIRQDGRHSDVLMSPILLGCKTKVPKIVSTSIGALQRLVALKAVPQRSVAQVIQTLGSVINQGVDIQLRVLQTELSLLTHCPDIHGEVLGQALLLCFKLHDVKIPVVSSTAAATLRQAVMLIFDRVTSEDSTAPPLSAGTSARPAVDITPLPCASDAIDLFHDLCLLTGTTSKSVVGFLGGGTEQKKARMLKLTGIGRTFGFELIESVLGGFEEGVKRHDQLLDLLRHDLCPLLLRTLHEHPTFPVTLRLMRLVYLLLRSFSDQLSPEAEVFFTILIKLAAGDSDALSEETMRIVNDDEEPVKASSSKWKDDKYTPPHWLKVIAMEILRGLCNDATLVEAMFARYDAVPGRRKVFGSLINTLGRLVTENPTVMGVCPELQGLGVSSDSATHLYGTPGPGTSAAAGYLDLGLSVVTSAANVGVSTVNAMMGSETTGALGVASAMKLQCIEQHDKAEPPLIPEGYVYLLAVQTLNVIVNGVDRQVQQLTTSESNTIQYEAICESAWPGLLAAYSYLLGTNLDQELFTECLETSAAFTTVCGRLRLETPRDAFLTSLARLAVPPPLVAASQTYSDVPQTPRATNMLSVDSLSMGMLGVGSSAPPTLSSRNLACLRTLLSLARTQASHLGQYWFTIFEVLQNASHILAARKTAPMSRRITAPAPNSIMASPSKSRTTSFHEGVNDQGQGSLDHLSSEIDELFTVTRSMQDSEFKVFISSLIRLGKEMMGLLELAPDDIPQTPNLSKEPYSPRASISSNAAAPFSPPTSGMRRSSGLRISNITRAEKSFSLDHLRAVSLLNVHRLVRNTEALDLICAHLLDICGHGIVTSSIRVQAAQSLVDLLMAALHALPEDMALAGSLQEHVFNYLLTQTASRSVAGGNGMDLDIRLMGLQTLASIVESSGHAIVTGWHIVFRILGSVCVTASSDISHNNRNNNPRTLILDSPPARHISLPGSTSTTRGAGALVRLAFPVLTLISTDYWSTLDQDGMRACISALGQYGAQRDDVNISLSAIGCLWNLSDALRGSCEDAYADELWLNVLEQLVALSHDGRQEVRSGSLQTLFRCIDAHGSELSEALWSHIATETVGTVIKQLWDRAEQPLLANEEEQHPTEAEDDADVFQRKHWDETKALILTSISAILPKFYNRHIEPLAIATEFRRSLLDKIVEVVSADGRLVCSAALECMRTLATEAVTRDKDECWDELWCSFKEISYAVSRNAEGTGEAEHYAPYTQDNLQRLVSVTLTLVQLGSNRLSAPDVTFLLNIIRTVVVYARSPSYALDVDSMTPVQTASLELLISMADLSPQSRALILSDLAEMLTLAFVAEFEYVDRSYGRSSAKKPVTGKITYVALWKRAAPAATEMAISMAGDAVAYQNGSIEKVLGAFGLPMKLKYDCPPANKFGNDRALWKTATECFVAVARPVVVATLSTGVDIPPERFGSLYHQLVDAMQSALLADSAQWARLDIEERIEEEAFDAAILGLLCDELLPVLGHERIPSEIVQRIGDTLAKASLLWQYIGNSSQDTGSLGTTAPAESSSKEDYRYWCLGLLFDGVQTKNGLSGEEEARAVRVASAFLPPLISRCRRCLQTFLADAPLRGGMPFERVRNEEIGFILRRLRDLCLWKDTYEDVADNTGAAPAVRPVLLASSLAHLFDLYPLLLQILALPGRSPSVSVMPAKQCPTRPLPAGYDSETMVDIRLLALQSLEKLGKGMGAMS